MMSRKLKSEMGYSETEETFLFHVDNFDYHYGFSVKEYKVSSQFQDSLNFIVYNKICIMEKISLI